MARSEAVSAEAIALKARVDDLYARYADTICDGKIAAWPDFFTEQCHYLVIPRGNYERGMKLGPMFAETRGGLIDRATAIENALVYAPRALCYVVGSIRIVAQAAGAISARSMFAAYHTLAGRDTELLMAGRSFDKLAAEGDALKFAERVVVFDTELIPGALIFPM